MGVRRYPIRFIPIVDETYVWFGAGRAMITAIAQGNIASEIRQWAASNGIYMSKLRVHRLGLCGNRGYMRMTADQVFAFKMRWA